MQTTPDAMLASPDYTSIDGVVRALYENLSGPAGPRPWDRVRALYADEARLMVVRRLTDGDVALDVFDLDAYAASRAPFFAANSFYETEVARRVERFGSLAHVFSTYESRREPDTAPFMRGINSIQLVWQRERWWVLSVLWQQEATDVRIPDRYLVSEPPEQ
jgi:hypothetical protein